MLKNKEQVVHQMIKYVFSSSFATKNVNIFMLFLLEFTNE